ncbi:MAG: hypothetical protein Q8L07_08940 [Sediminibacterium sp.]|nr:hypothetical protein [Sediminibacterium sp.]
MKTFLFFIITFCCILQPATAQQRVVADCTITYAISADEGNAEKDVIESLKASSKIVYIRGNDSRTDLVTPSFTQSLLYDKRTGIAVILREFGNNKFITRLDAKSWAAENNQYEGMKISFVNNENKTILGYECKKAVIQLKDGRMFTLFYATTIIPSVREFEYEFKDIPGFVLEFESQEAQNRKIRYTATKINLTPVQASKFDIPKSGYRLLN